MKARCPLKSDFILSLCELIVGGKGGLAAGAENHHRPLCAAGLSGLSERPAPGEYAHSGGFVYLLRAQEEKRQQYIATALEIYVTGSLNVFNHRTNVDINNRIVCYDIKELGKQLKKIGMLVVQDQVWNRVTINRAAHKSTRYYIDEMHLLLKEEQTAAYTVEIWKRFRNGAASRPGSRRTSKDLLCSREVENIFENSGLRVYAQPGGRGPADFAKQLGISPAPAVLCDPLRRGRRAFVLRFHDPALCGPLPEKNTELYRIMTTKTVGLEKRRMSTMKPERN